MSSTVKFCTSCDNLLEKIIINNYLLFVCENCQRRYQASPEDTLFKERVKGIDVILPKALEKAVDDPATIKAYVKCIKNTCAGKIVKQVRMNDYSSMLNICTECRFTWLAN
ncbi:MAG: hypothetical protein ACRCZI_13135 [Cetobacterium sp.]